MHDSGYLFLPRPFKEIGLWRDVRDDQWNSPQWQLNNCIQDVAALSRVIDLDEGQQQAIQNILDILLAQGKSPMRITPYYAALMAQNPFRPQYADGEVLEDALDPVFWQSVPTPAHMLFPRAGVEQAMAESERMYGAFYQRYPNRGALFVCENTSCASFCTHCQRIKSLDMTTSVTPADIEKGLFYIAHNPNIDEVLVTGGDAFRINSASLYHVMEKLCSIPHVRCIRLATRVPVTMPMGITDDLLETIVEARDKHSNGLPKNIYFMTHVNHYHEITQDFVRCIQKIKRYGFAVKNQTVFINHVNADFYTLVETFRRMWWAGVAPYYLLQCHKEKGLTHFIAPIVLGQFFMRHLQGWISGTCKPLYAVNVEGGGGKVLLTPSGYNLDNPQRLKAALLKTSASIHTWDDEIIRDYEALGRTTRQEYDEAMAVMERFVGRRGVFHPAVIIVDDQGVPVTSMYDGPLPRLNNAVKADLLRYQKESDGMPLTNPADSADRLDALFEQSQQR